jgi:hypothetical protein
MLARIEKQLKRKRQTQSDGEEDGKEPNQIAILHRLV